MSKTKRLRGALAATLAGGALVGALAVSGAGAQAPPVLYFGTITINGEPAPVAGTIVTIVEADGGDTCVTASAGGAAPNVIGQDASGNTVYGAQVQNQGVPGPTDDCELELGEEVEIYVNGILATTVEHPGQTTPNFQVNLSITVQEPTPTSEPTESPTESPTETATTPAATTPAGGTATPRPPDTGLGGSDDGSNLGLLLGLAVAAAAGLGASGYVLARRSR